MIAISLLGRLGSGGASRDGTAADDRDVMPAAGFKLRDQLGEIVIDNPPLNLFGEGLIADLRAAPDQAAASEVWRPTRSAYAPISLPPQS